MQPTRLCMYMCTNMLQSKSGRKRQTINREFLFVLNCSPPIVKMSHWLIGALELISDDYYRDLPIMGDITILLDITLLASDSCVSGPVIVYFCPQS